jgi:ubiquinol-cytochrome c reductase cytochrome b subunit
MITRRIARWFDDRLRAASFAQHALNKVFPDDWSFMLGEIALYTFVILVLTGTFLAFFFEPSTRQVAYNGAYKPLDGTTISEAYSSVLRISFEVRGGMVFRQMHHWAALVFVAAIVTHLMRIFFTGAFRRPRELNWIIGVTMLLLGIFNGFSGYSLPDDLLSGTGLRIAYSVALSIPVIGTWIAFLVFGGEFPSGDIIRRLLVLHIMIVPGILLALIAAHLAILWHQKHTQFPGPGRTETNVVGPKLFPTYAARSVGLFFGITAVLGAIGGLVQINPVWLYGPFRPEAVSSPGQPDWYLGWLEGALRIFPAWEIRAFGHSIPNLFFPAVVLPGFTFAMLYAWPFLEQRFTGDRAEHQLLDRPREHPVRTAIGAMTFTFYALLLIAGSNDIVAKMFLVPVNGVTWAMRILVVVLPLLVGGLFYWWLHALARSGAERPMHVPLEAFVAAYRPTAAGRRPGAGREPVELERRVPEPGRGWALGDGRGPVDAPGHPVEAPVEAQVRSAGDQDRRSAGDQDRRPAGATVVTVPQPAEPPRGWAVGEMPGAPPDVRRDGAAGPPNDPEEPA